MSSDAGSSDAGLPPMPSTSSRPRGRSTR